MYGPSSSTNASATPIVIISVLVALALLVFVIAATWRIYTKAGRPGWAAIIPIYNLLVLLQVIGRPWWWILLFLVPFVNIVIGIIVYNDLSKSFGRGVGFTLGLIFLRPIFLGILGFGGSQYVGPGANR